MLPLNDHFDGLLKNLNPPEHRQTLAEDLPPIVRDHLRKSDLLDTVEEPPVSRLAGSYGRRTVSGDIHDVDIVIFVAASYRRKPVERVLDDLAAALKDLEVEGYEKGDVKTNRKQRRSCHVEFRLLGSDDPAFHIDVVPVIRPGDDPNARDAFAARNRLLHESAGLDAIAVDEAGRLGREFDLAADHVRMLEEIAAGPPDEKGTA